MKKLPHILQRSIIFYKDPEGDSGGGDHFEEQEHERQGGEGGGGDSSGGDGSGGDASFEERKASFFERFSASNNAPGAEGGSHDKELESRKTDEERKAKEREKQIQEGKQRKHEGGNIKKILEDKRTAEKERDDLKAKIEKYETEEKAALTKQVTDLQAKIDSGEFSPKKEAEMQARITELEGEMKTKEEALVNENMALKKKLSFHDLANDDQFREQYIEPVNIAYQEAMDVLTDEKFRTAFTQALQANQMALRAGNDANKRAAMEKQRDEILSGIVEALPQFSGQRFTRAATDYIRAAQNHAKALFEHESTAARLRQQAQERGNAAVAKRLQEWDKTYKTTREGYKEFDVDDETKKAAKELGFDLDESMTKSEAIAAKVINGQTSLMDTMDLIHKGRVHPQLRARILVLEKHNKDKDALIAKLRASNTKGGDGGGAGGEGSGRKEGEKETREEWQQRKFGAGRKNLVRPS